MYSINPLATLPALQKVHHQWPLPLEMLVQPAYSALLHDLARVTHTIPAGNLWTLEKDPLGHAAAVAAAEIAASSNATVDVQYSPWGQDDSPFPKDAPPTLVGPDEDKELALFAERLARAKRWIETEGNAVVGAILIDQERWDARGANATWTAAITRKNNLIYRAAKACFPRARFVAYGRGDISRAANDVGWGTNGFYTLAKDEDGDVFGTSLYTLPELGYTREGFNRTAARAQEHGQGVAPWVALGAGFVRDMAFWHWDYTYDFPVIFSWKLGQELNQGWFSADWRRRTRFADWRRAQEVVIYPSPFDPSCAPRANSSWKACFQVRTQ